MQLGGVGGDDPDLIGRFNHVRLTTDDRAGFLEKRGVIGVMRLATPKISARGFNRPRAIQPNVICLSVTNWLLNMI